MQSKNETVVLGGGCFWCTEAVFKMLKGVVSTMPGYAGGTTKNPTYDEVCSGTTGHTEVLRIEYDPKTIPFDKVLEVFFEMHDPTSMDRQGADVGAQYRSLVLYSTEKQKAETEGFIKKIQSKFKEPVVTQIKKLDKFYPAEDYHKDYFDKNPLQPYCIFVTRPKVNKIKKEFAALIK